MGKKKPLTKYQQFIADGLPNWTKNISRTKRDGEDDQGNAKWEWVQEERTPTEWRRLLKGRMEGNNEDYFLKCRERFAKLKNAFQDAATYSDLEHAFWMFKHALKYQGGLRMEIVFLEDQMMKGTDKELRKEVKELISKGNLARKVAKINRPSRKGWN